MRDNGSIRRRLSIPMVLLACVCVGVYACVPTRRSVVGSYTADSGSGAAVIEVKADGTFSRYDGGGQKMASGHWRLDSD